MPLAIIDDSPTNRSILKHLSSAIYDGEVLTCPDPVSALRLLQQEDIDAIIVDYVMPGMDGIEFTSKARAVPGGADIPIVMITNSNERGIRLKALEAGATDFLSKPIDPAEYKARLRNLLKLNVANAALRCRGEAAITSPAGAANALRLAHFHRLIARGLGLGPGFCRSIFLAAMMPDLATIRLPETLLLGQGQLTGSDVIELKRYAPIAERLQRGELPEAIVLACRMTATSGEHWNGGGRPRGLKGEAIPLGGRIAALAHMLEAAISVMAAGSPLVLDPVLDRIELASNGRFDPACVEALMDELPAVLAICQTTAELADPA